jgi:hypothetical protein
MCFFILGLFINLHYSYALNPSPQSGSAGLTGTVPSTPPSVAATIATPTSGQNFTSLPVTISGICPSNLLIKIYINNIFSGSSECVSGSYSIISDLFEGSNVIIARDYDNLSQSGPDSNSVNVSYASNLNPSGSPITLASNYAELGANPGTILSWPIQITGGSPSYALSVDWGDGEQATLMSKVSSGELNLSHTYIASGVYTILIKATDVSGNLSFLQLVGVANGPASQTSLAATAKTNSTTKSAVISMPNLVVIIVGLIMIPLIAFILGSMHRKKEIQDKLQKKQDPF